MRPELLANLLMVEVLSFRMEVYGFLTPERNLDICLIRINFLILLEGPHAQLNDADKQLVREERVNIRQLDPSSCNDYLNMLPDRV
jgi:hypothetical protein